MYICPQCHYQLIAKAFSLVCSGCRRNYPISNGIPRLMPSSWPDGSKKSHSVWLQLYQQGLRHKQLIANRFAHYTTIGKQEYAVIAHHTSKKAGTFLEIGCGTHMTGLEMAKRGWSTFGIDFVFANLLEAKHYWKASRRSPHLIQGDISSLPYKNNVFDLVYGGGVIEHPTNTQQVINELFRVTKPGGVCINTVPAFSLSSLTYRQLAGNIPDLAVLKQIFEFMHIKLLGGRLMHCGYEKSFTASKLVTMHKKAGFSDIQVEHLTQFSPVFPGIPPLFKKVFTALETNRLFWAWHIVVATK